jgi:hypothetical protein
MSGLKDSFNQSSKLFSVEVLIGAKNGNNAIELAFW